MVQSLLQTWMVEGSSSSELARESRVILSVKFVGTQMLPMFPNGQMGPTPGKTQHHNHVVNLGRQTRVLLRNNPDLCVFQILNVATQRKRSLLVLLCFSFLSEMWLIQIFVLPLESSKRINKCFPLLLLFGMIGRQVGRQILKNISTLQMKIYTLQIYISYILKYTCMYLSTDIHISTYIHTDTWRGAERENIYLIQISTSSILVSEMIKLS